MKSTVWGTETVRIKSAMNMNTPFSSPTITTSLPDSNQTTVERQGEVLLLSFTDV